MNFNVQRYAAYVALERHDTSTGEKITILVVASGAVVISFSIDFLRKKKIAGEVVVTGTTDRHLR